MRLSRVASSIAVVIALTTTSIRPAAAATEGYVDPPFGPACEVHQFGEGEWPPLALWKNHELCVEYSKRDITMDNGGALRFLLAEPSRFALALPVCRYWQQDHWSVQSTVGATPIVTWDGSYWFDKKSRVAAFRLTNFRIAGVSVGIGDAVLAIQDEHPLLAEALAVYGDEGGESGARVTLPYSLWCSVRP